MTTPDTIYLQVDDDDGPLDPSDLTFCADRVNDSDVVYIRADMADRAFASWEKAIQDLRAFVAGA